MDTLLLLEHVALADDLAMWDECGPGAVGVGWDLTFLGLAEHLRTGEPVNLDALGTEIARGKRGRRGR